MFNINILNKKRNDLPIILKTSDIILFENLKKDKLKISNETINLARKGDGRAQFLVVNEYYHNNTRTDYLKALEWYHRSASSGYANAQCSLGYMYYCGNESMPADKQEAVQWYAAAASQGNAGAQQMLQNLNAQGYFTQSDNNTDVNPSYYNNIPVEYEQEVQQKQNLNTTPPNEEKNIKYYEKLPPLPARANSTPEIFQQQQQQGQKPNEYKEDDYDVREYAIENERLKAEIRGLLKQHEEDVQEKEDLAERIRYLEEKMTELEKIRVVGLEKQIEKLAIERDEAIQAGAVIQEPIVHHNNIYDHHSNRSGEDLNNDLNYDTPEE